MDAKSIINKALNGYLVYTQMDGCFCGDYKKSQAEACISYIARGGIVSEKWLKEQTILNEALRLYSDTLKDELYGDSSGREEYRLVNMLIQKTQ